MTRPAWIVALVIAVAAGGSGCTGCTSGGGPGAADGAPRSGAAADEIGVRLAEKLPPVGEYLPPLDDARMEVAAPEGWTVVPRSTSALVTFVARRGQEFPRITINAQQPPAELASDLTPENVDPVLAWQDRELQGKGAALWEGVLPLILGETVFIRHVRRAKDASGTPLVVQSLQTVQGGRHYTVELIVEIDAPRAEDYEQSLTEWRDHAYAAAASMRFAPAGERFDPLAEIGGAIVEEPPASDPPADPAAPGEPPAGPQPTPMPEGTSPEDESP